MLYYIIFIVAGYLLGSILFAPIFGYLLKEKDITSGTKDHNPGTANAFMQGGILCGILTLLGDLGKGFLPVCLCLHFADKEISSVGLALVMLAPVLGHTVPIYHKFHGGKGIATTFGCLLGYAPNLIPALILAIFFILFSLVIRITPHFHRTIGTYICATGIFFVWSDTLGQKLGFLLITVVVCIRMHLSKEEREECKVNLLWMH